MITNLGGPAAITQMNTLIGVGVSYSAVSEPRTIKQNHTIWYKDPRTKW